MVFLVAPATLLAPSVMMRLTTGPKNPVKAYPTTGAAGLYPHSDFQIMIQPAVTGRQQVISIGMRVFGIREAMYPQSGMKIRQMPPTGNWKRIESRVSNPKVDTISGPKPEMAPLMVYLKEKLDEYGQVRD